MIDRTFISFSAVQMLKFQNSVVCKELSRPSSVLALLVIVVSLTRSSIVVPKYLTYCDVSRGQSFHMKLFIQK